MVSLILADVMCFGAFFTQFLVMAGQEKKDPAISIPQDVTYIGYSRNDESTSCHHKLTFTAKLFSPIL